MRALVSAIAVAAVILSACAEPAPDEVPRSTAPPRPVADPVATHEGGRPATLDLAPAEVPRLVQRYVGDRGAGEPTLAINTRGAVLYPSLEFEDGDPFGTLILYLSIDEGVTWVDVASSPLADGSDVPMTSLDPYVYADPATDRLYSVDLTLACAYLRWTDDDGASWEVNPLACGTPITDHQTLFAGPPVGSTTTAGYPNVLYYCSNRVYEAVCDTSVDGGRTFRPGTAAFAASDLQRISTDEGGCAEEALHGHGHADATTGTVYLPKVGPCGARVAISEDNGQTWRVVLVDDSVGSSGHDASIATDSEANAYFFFLDENSLPRLSVSVDGGTSWGPPMAVGHPNVTAARYPQIVAGDSGRIAFLYVGTTHAQGSIDYAGPPEFAPAPFPDQTWEAYVGYSFDASLADPVFVTVTAHDPADPLKRGHCYGGCGGSQDDGNGMRDFLDIDIHPTTGQVWVALVDLCTETTAPGYSETPCNTPDGTPDSYQAARGAVGVQVEGLTLRQSLDRAHG